MQQQWQWERPEYAVLAAFSFRGGLAMHSYDQQSLQMDSGHPWFNSIVHLFS